MIVIEPCAGLGNRFIALASAYHAAKELNQKLIVIWKEETVLGASMDKLFGLPKDVEVVSISEYGYKQDFFGQIRGNFIKKSYRNAAAAFFECDEIMDLYNQQGRDGIKRLVEEKKDVYIKATNPFWDIFEIDHAFDFITPQPEILERKNAILKAAAGKKIVGVHVRRTDHIESITNSPLELFIAKMQEELKEEPDTYFYLASDDKGVEEELRQVFPDRILTFSDKSLKRDDEQGIKDAYVEMLCLSSGSKIYGSFNSTFSVMASKFGNIPLYVVRAEQ
ncbi:MAG: Nodulation protein Z (NodZ) [Lachnospiraceae bacterium]